MRYVKTKVPSFEELGLLSVLRNLAESPRGILLVSGSTGCGKSTIGRHGQHINAN
jgi:Tfp pilus assembly pilus retraction ATPase PilT